MRVKVRTDGASMALLEAALDSLTDKPLLAVVNAFEPGRVLQTDIVAALFERLGLNKREAKDMVEAFFEVIRDALENGESVKLSGFGNFQLRDKPQRPGRNPKTGEAIPIAARRVVTFHASQKLKALVESGAEPAVPVRQ